MKAGQTERTDGPQSHLGKTGTPNMGGIMILLGLAAASLCMAARCPEVIPVLILSVGFGIVGFMDDYLKVVKKKSDGLSVKQKLAMQEKERLVAEKEELYRQALTSSSIDRAKWEGELKAKLMELKG